MASRERGRGTNKLRFESVPVMVAVTVELGLRRGNSWYPVGLMRKKLGQRGVTSVIVSSQKVRVTIVVYPKGGMDFRSAVAKSLDEMKKWITTPDMPRDDKELVSSFLFDDFSSSNNNVGWFTSNMAIARNGPGVVKLVQKVVVGRGKEEEKEVWVEIAKKKGQGIVVSSSSGLGVEEKLKTSEVRLVIAKAIKKEKLNYESSETGEEKE